MIQIRAARVTYRFRTIKYNTKPKFAVAGLRCLSTHSSAPTIITVASVLLLCSLREMSDHKATLIDGKAIAQTIRSEIAAEVRRLSQTSGKVPGLAVVIVGKRKDSQSYVNMKRKACAEVGIKSVDLDLPEEVSESELISKVHELNANPDVHGWYLSTASTA
ncbi:UNVERIFIED_CONTAM: Bifunctional protein FolD 2 [Sesamum radiatum]|uniref:Bifunctional protein FolD 2 n=1 Tax=Sesamum radiatum TaxID=300843 RepID=A0AAW2W704_SESRA